MVLLARSACSCVHVGKQQKHHEASDLAFLFLEQGHPPKLVLQAFAVARQPLLATSVLLDPARWQGQARRAQAHHLKVRSVQLDVFKRYACTICDGGYDHIPVLPCLA